VPRVCATFHPELPWVINKVKVIKRRAYDYRPSPASANESTQPVANRTRDATPRNQQEPPRCHWCCGGAAISARREEARGARVAFYASVRAVRS